MNKHLLIGYMVGLLIIPGAYHYGKIHENKRIFACFTHPHYSGFAWVEGSDYFTCSHTIEKGTVIYKHKKG